MKDDDVPQFVLLLAFVFFAWHDDLLCLWRYNLTFAVYILARLCECSVVPIVLTIHSQTTSQWQAGSVCLHPDARMDTHKYSETTGQRENLMPLVPSLRWMQAQKYYFHLTGLFQSYWSYSASEVSSASEVTTLWRYTNLFIIIIIFFIPQVV